jgi:hypothetical protein
MYENVVHKFGREGALCGSGMHIGLYTNRSNGSQTSLGLNRYQFESVLVSLINELYLYKLGSTYISSYNFIFIVFIVLF